MFTYRGYEIKISEAKKFEDGDYTVKSYGLSFRVSCSLGVAYGQTPYMAEALIRNLIDEHIATSQAKSR
jgi:hypothetical protein